MTDILNKNVVLFALVAIALTGCAHVRVSEFEIEVAAAINPQSACPSWRRVALKTDPEGQCPNPGAVTVMNEGSVDESWEIEHLFTVVAPNLDPASAEYATVLPPALRPFCLYEYKRNAAQTLVQLNKKLDSLVGSERSPKAFKRIDAGCAAVGPAAGEKPSQRAPWQEDLEGYFLQQIGDVEPVTPFGSGSLGADPALNVRLSFLDTQPGAKVDPGANSQHGYALAQIARKMVCDETGATANSCTAEIEYRLALPIERFVLGNPELTKINQDLGGFSGSVDFLANAVWDAVKDPTLSPQQHLVLNLSLAWDGELFGGLEDDVAEMPVTVQAMYRALEVASCRGALVVAAAGNRRGGPSDEYGPLLPGGWELRDAPTSAACQEILGAETAARFPHHPSREPLVYAAGGVRFDNTPLYNARPGATPPRVAYASHALVGESLKPLTGTSVATAVISSTAATVWHHWPSLARAELMDLLYRAGEPIARSAELYHPSFALPPETHRVSVCPTLALVCAELGGRCPGKCPDRPTEKPAWSRDAVSCTKTIDARKIKEETRVRFCGDHKILYDPAVGMPVAPCPARQFYGATAMAWQGSTLPQPEDDPCMGCGGVGTQTSTKSGVRSLMIEIDPAWKKTFSQAFLDIGNYSLALGVGELEGVEGERRCVLVENLDIDKLGGKESNPYMILRFSTEDKRTISVPLLF